MSEVDSPGEDLSVQETRVVIDLDHKGCVSGCSRCIRMLPAGMFLFNSDGSMAGFNPSCSTIEDGQVYGPYRDYNKPALQSSWVGGVNSEELARIRNTAREPSGGAAKSEAMACPVGKITLLTDI